MITFQSAEGRTPQTAGELPNPLNHSDLCAIGGDPETRRALVAQRRSLLGSMQMPPLGRGWSDRQEAVSSADPAQFGCSLLFVDDLNDPVDDVSIHFPRPPQAPEARENNGTRSSTQQAIAAFNPAQAKQAKAVLNKLLKGKHTCLTDDLDCLLRQALREQDTGSPTLAPLLLRPRSIVLIGQLKEEHDGTSAVQQMLLDLLAAALNTKIDVKRRVLEDATHSAVQSLRSHPEHDAVVAAACRLLLAVINYPERGDHVAAREGIALSLADVITEARTTSNADQHLLMMLYHWLHPLSHRLDATDAKTACFAATLALKRHAAHSDVARHACAVVHHTAQKLGVRCDPRAESVVGAIVDAARTHATSAAVQRNALGALASLACYSGTASKIVAQGVLPDVARSMRQHMHDLQVQAQGMRVLSTCCEASRELVAPVLAVGGLSFALQVFAHADCDTTALTQAGRLLHVLCYQQSCILPRVLRAGVVQAAARASVASPDCYALHVSMCLLLVLLVRRSEAAVRDLKMLGSPLLPWWLLSLLRTPKFGWKHPLSGLACQLLTAVWEPAPKALVRITLRAVVSALQSHRVHKDLCATFMRTAYTIVLSCRQKLGVEEQPVPREQALGLLHAAIDLLRVNPAHTNTQNTATKLLNALYPDVLSTTALLEARFLKAFGPIAASNPMSPAACEQAAHLITKLLPELKEMGFDDSSTHKEADSRASLLQDVDGNLITSVLAIQKHSAVSARVQNITCQLLLDLPQRAWKGFDGVLAMEAAEKIIHVMRALDHNPHGLLVLAVQVLRVLCRKDVVVLSAMVEGGCIPACMRVIEVHPHNITLLQWTLLLLAEVLGSCSSKPPLPRGWLPVLLRQMRAHASTPASVITDSASKIIVCGVAGFDTWQEDDASGEEAVTVLLQAATHFSHPSHVRFTMFQAVMCILQRHQKTATWAAVLKEDYFEQLFNELRKHQANQEWADVLIQILTYAARPWIGGPARPDRDLDWQRRCLDVISVLEQHPACDRLSMLAFELLDSTFLRWVAAGCKSDAPPLDAEENGAYDSEKGANEGEMKEKQAKEPKRQGHGEQTAGLEQQQQQQQQREHQQGFRQETPEQDKEGGGQHGSDKVQECNNDNDDNIGDDGGRLHKEAQGEHGQDNHQSREEKARHGGDGMSHEADASAVTATASKTVTPAVYDHTIDDDGPGRDDDDDNNGDNGDDDGHGDDDGDDDDGDDDDKEEEEEESRYGFDCEDSCDEAPYWEEVCREAEALVIQQHEDISEPESNGEAGADSLDPTAGIDAEGGEEPSDRGAGLDLPARVFAIARSWLRHVQATSASAKSLPSVAQCRALMSALKLLFTVYKHGTADTPDILRVSLLFVMEHVLQGGPPHEVMLLCYLVVDMVQHTPVVDVFAHMASRHIVCLVLRRLKTSLGQAAVQGSLLTLLKTCLHLPGAEVLALLIDEPDKVGTITRSMVACLKDSTVQEHGGFILSVLARTPELQSTVVQHNAMGAALMALRAQPMNPRVVWHACLVLRVLLDNHRGRQQRPRQLMAVKVFQELQQIHHDTPEAVELIEDVITLIQRAETEGSAADEGAAHSERGAQVMRDEGTVAQHEQQRPTPQQRRGRNRNSRQRKF